MTSYRAISQDGRSYTTTTVTDEQTADFGQYLSDLFDAGVARFGSVDAFQNALTLHVAERKVA